METDDMKLVEHSFCADINARGCLEVNRQLMDFMHCAPQ